METELDEKNALVNRIRMDSGQQPHAKTTTETQLEELRERLSGRVEPEKPEEAAGPAKTHEQLLAEKNKLTESTKLASDAVNQQREQSEADRAERASKSKK